MYEDNLLYPRIYHAEIMLWKNHYKAQDTRALPSIPSLCHASELAYPRINTLPKMLYVLSVTVCEGESNFSSVLLLKTHLLSTMGQSHLNGLVLCHIHNKTSPDVDEVLAVFIVFLKRGMELYLNNIQSKPLNNFDSQKYSLYFILLFSCSILYSV